MSGSAPSTDLVWHNAVFPPTRCRRRAVLLASAMTNFLLTAIIILLGLGLIGNISQWRADQRGEQQSPALTLLPGDIKYESKGGNFKFYFPITTSILLSLILTLAMRLFS